MFFFLSRFAAAGGALGSMLAAPKNIKTSRGSPAGAGGCPPRPAHKKTPFQRSGRGEL